MYEVLDLSNVENGSVYLVDFNDIIADYPKDEIQLLKIEKIKFFNPRFLTGTKLNPYGVGFEKENMEVQRESIINNGLINPFIGRIDSNGKIQLIDGHRRRENINYCKKNNIDCFDQTTNEYVDAYELYQKVPVKIYKNLTDYDAFSLAFNEEKTKVKFGTEAEIKFLMLCQKAGIPESEIVNCLGKSLSWYNSTMSYLKKLKDDNVTLESLISGEINQVSAKLLSDIDDVEDRHKVLETSKEKAKYKAEDKSKKIDESINKSLDQKEFLLAKKAQAEFFADKDAIEESIDDIEEVDEKIELKQEKKAKASSKKVGSKEIKEALKELNIEDEISEKSKTNEKLKSEGNNYSIEEVWLNPLKDLQFNDCKNESGDIVVKNQVFVDAMIDLIYCISTKSGDLETFLMNWGDKI
jgi:hypothetical protein